MRKWTCLSAALLIPAGRCLAALKQEDVFRSISENVRESDADPRTMPMFLLIGAALVMFVVLVSLRRNRRAVPKALNHQGKLLKELMRRMSLKTGEWKQLRLLADATRSEIVSKKETRGRPGEEDEADADGGDGEGEGEREAGPGRSEIENPLVFILCPSLLMRAMQTKPPKVDKKVVAGLARKMGLVRR